MKSHRLPAKTVPTGPVRLAGEIGFTETPISDAKSWRIRFNGTMRWLSFLGNLGPALTLGSAVLAPCPDGAYRLDNPADVDWAKATARLVKQLDPYRHLVTVHPVISSSARGASPRDPLDLPWRIGGFFGDDNAFDVLSQQTGQSGKGVTWDERLQCWMGDDPELVTSLRTDRRFQKPVLNTENGYEYLRGHPTERKQVHHTDKVRRSAWRIVCAGGYFAAGFNGTIGHSDVWNRIDAPNQYPFTVRDEGAAEQLGALHAFFAALPFWRMQPFEGVTGDGAVAVAELG